MAVPKRKTSPSRRGMRQSHQALGQTAVSEDSVTGKQVRPHHVSKDGNYNGKKVTTATKKVKI